MKATATQEATAAYRSPFGWLRLTATDKGIRRIDWIRKPLRSKAAPPSALADCIRVLDDYFAGHAPDVLRKLKLDWAGTSAFRQKVWRALLKVKSGQVVSYAELARRSGSPAGARAVARCMATNPIPILVPCHRVIRSDGDLGGFGGGIEWKTKLLQHEGVKVVRTLHGSMKVEVGP